MVDADTVVSVLTRRSAAMRGRPFFFAVILALLACRAFGSLRGKAVKPLDALILFAADRANSNVFSASGEDRVFFAFVVAASDLFHKYFQSFFSEA
jgi:hypothetical protein